MGFKLKDNIPLVPNTDPTRVQDQSNLPLGACEVTSEPWLFNLTVQTNQYYLQPNVPLDVAEALSRTASRPLKRVFWQNKN